jgi:putative peptidoglycan lipid II flippase
MYTPVLNNLAVIAIFVAFRAAYGEVTLETVSTAQLLLIGVGTTAGVALMGVAQIPFLRGLGRYRATFSISHPSVRKLARLSVWVIGYVVVNQIGYLVVQRLATGQPGAYSAYISAFTFFMLPHGLFAVSVITALLPAMSQHAVNLRWDEFRGQLSLGVRVTLLLALPAAVGLFVLAEPAVGILLDNGAVTRVSVELVAGVLRFFVLGLLPFSLFQLFLRAFYSMHDTKTPFVINCGAVALNTTINVVTFVVLDLGVRGLAAGHALAYAFGASLQARRIARRLGGIEAASIGTAALRISGAAGAMGAVVWTLWHYLAGPFAGLPRVLQVLALLAVAGAGAVAYVGLAALLRVEELGFLRGVIARRGPARAERRTR